MPSTKFSQRPAARKRPWICKRSPPCLIAPPIPKVLICSFWVRSMDPLTWGETVMGSMLIFQTAPTWSFEGTWTDPPLRMKINFEFLPSTNRAQAIGDWDSFTTTDTGDWEWLTVEPPPPMMYHSFNLSSTVNPWLGECLVTG